MVEGLRVRRLSLCAIAMLSVAVAAQQPLEQPRAILDRAIADFEGGRIAESAAGFDALIEVSPSLAPQLWQRGITLYYAGRYADCRAQFELHRTVNPADVENAAWHFLCVARAESAAKARAALLPVGPDARVPMRQIYEMYRGELEPEVVVEAAGAQLSRSVLRTALRGPLFRGGWGRSSGARAHHGRGRRPVCRRGRLHAYRR